MEFLIFVMPPELACQVDRLRVEGYSSATWFKLEDPTKVCLLSDFPGTQVLCVVPRDEPVTLVATTAVRVCSTREELEVSLSATVPERNFPTNSLVMSRLAVSKAWRGQRLNLLLMKFKIEQALVGGLAAVCATQAKGTPNVAGLQRLGFQYVEVASTRMESVNVDAGAMECCVLTRRAFPAALRQLEALLGASGISGTWLGEPFCPARAVRKAEHAI